MTAAHRVKEKTGRVHNTVNHLSMALLIGEMVDGPFTVRSIMEETGLSRVTAYRLVRAFHQKGVVHVTGWDKDLAGRVCVPVYTIGRGKDVKRKAKSRAEINRDFNERKRMREVAEGLNSKLAFALSVASNDSRKAA